jgi:hypothetical protein
MQAAYMTSNLSPHKMTQSLLFSRERQQSVDRVNRGERYERVWVCVYALCVVSWGFRVVMVRWTMSPKELRVAWNVWDRKSVTVTSVYWETFKNEALFVPGRM